MIEHSPAPWTWCEGSNGIKLLDAEGREIAWRELPIGLREGDLRLIAAAPELLAMLDRVTSALSKDAHSCADGTCLRCEAEALIARIKGVTG